MDDRQGPGGYGGPSGDSGSGFISLGHTDEPDNSTRNWKPWNQRGRRGFHHANDNRQGRGSYRGRDQPYPNDRFNRQNEQKSDESIPPFYRATHTQSSPNRGGPYRGGPPRGGPFRGGSQRGGPHRGGPHRGGPNWGRGRNQRFQGHDGARQSNFDRSSNIPISAYYHPSMVEDPWRDLENLFKGPQREPSSNNMECDNLDQQTTEDDNADNRNSGDDDDEGSEILS